MKSHVEFRSAKFPAYASEDEEVNPGRYGKRLAEYLERRLPEHGVTTGPPGRDDWGWVLSIEHPHLWIGCGNYEEYPDGFLCFVEPLRGYVREWGFRKRDMSERHATVVEALDRVLRSDPEIRDVRWWSEKETANDS
jgi:hypothetical protein